MNIIVENPVLLQQLWGRSKQLCETHIDWLVDSLLSDVLEDTVHDLQRIEYADSPPTPVIDAPVELVNVNVSQIILHAPVEDVKYGEYSRPQMIRHRFGSKLPHEDGLSIRSVALLNNAARAWTGYAAHCEKTKLLSFRRWRSHTREKKRMHDARVIADRIWEVKMVVKACRWWRAFVDLKQQENNTVVNVLTWGDRRLKLAVLRAWIAYHSAEKWRRGQLELALVLVQRSRLRHILRTLRKNATHCIGLRTAVRVWRSHLCLRVWRAWATWASKRVAKRSALDYAEDHTRRWLRERRLRHGWRRWRLMMPLLRAINRNKLTSTEHYQELLLRRCMTRWRKRCVWRNDMVQSFDIIRDYKQKRDKMRVLRYWRQQFVIHLALRTREERADERGAVCLRRRVLRVLAAHARHSRKLRRKFERAMGVHRVYTLASVWKRWRGFVRQEQRVARRFYRAKEIHEHYTRLAYWHNWQRYLDKRRRKHAYLAKACCYYQRMVKRRRMRRWQKFVQDQYSRRIQEDKADKHYVRALMRGAWTTYGEWRKLMADQRVKYESALEFSSLTTLGHHWRRWKRWMRLRRASHKAKARATEWYHERLLSRTLRQLSRAPNVTSDRELEADHWHRMFVRQRLFAHWRECVGTRARRERLCELALEMCRRKRLMAGFDAIWDEVENARISQEKGAVFFNRRLASRALLKWIVYTNYREEKREKEETAVEYLKLKLTEKHFNNWRIWLYDEQTRDRENIQTAIYIWIRMLLRRTTIRWFRWTQLERARRATEAAALAQAALEERNGERDTPQPEDVREEEEVQNEQQPPPLVVIESAPSDDPEDENEGEPEPTQEPVDLRGSGGSHGTASSLNRSGAAASARHLGITHGTGVGHTMSGGPLLSDTESTPRLPSTTTGERDNNSSSNSNNSNNNNNNNSNNNNSNNRNNNNSNNNSSNNNNSSSNSNRNRSSSVNPLATATPSGAGNAKPLAPAPQTHNNSSAAHATTPPTSVEPPKRHRKRSHHHGAPQEETKQTGEAEEEEDDAATTTTPRVLVKSREKRAEMEACQTFIEAVPVHLRLPLYNACLNFCGDVQPKQGPILASPREMARRLWPGLPKRAVNLNWWTLVACFHAWVRLARAGREKRLAEWQDKQQKHKLGGGGGGLRSLFRRSKS